MKSISANLKTHLEGTALTVSTLWKITRQDAQVFGFTDSSSDLVYAGTTYLAATGHVPSNIKSTADLSVDNLEVESVLNSTTITDADIAAGLWDNALVEIMVVNYASLADGHMMLRKGTIGNIKTGRTAFIAELRGMTQPLQQTIGRSYKSGCDVLLGSTKCGVNLTPFTETGFATAVVDKRIFLDLAHVNANGYFDGGLIEWSSGANDTLRMEIKKSELAYTTVNSIIDISKEATALVTIGTPPVPFSNGDTVTFAACAGMTQINGLLGVVSAVTSTDFRVAINTTAFSTYTGSLGEAARFDGTRFTLQLPMPYDIEIADAYSVIAGCDKTFATCKAKFNNVVNFRGFPHIPGADMLVSGGR